jgi:hypothetical protein
MTYRTSIRVETTLGIRDDTKRTGDLLTQVIGILGLETKTPLTKLREGDGATVVPYATFYAYFCNQRRTLALFFKKAQTRPWLKVQNKNNYRREGLQDSVINKRRAGSKVHPVSKLSTNVKSYYSKPTLTRNISSQALNNLELYKHGYDIIKSKPGPENKSPGSDGQTIDDTSIKKLTKLRDAVVN